MAKASFPRGIDRRRLLASAAAAATLSDIVPHLGGVEAVRVPDAAQAMSAAPDVPALNVSARTARRLLEIGRRNKIRREANLPLLSPVRELRRMKKAEIEEEFARFEAAHGRTALQEALMRRQGKVGDPSWRPSWMESVAFKSRVRRLLLEQFNQARGVASTRTITMTS